MSGKQCFTTLAVLIAMGFTPWASAQQSSDDTDNRTFGQRLGDFGRNILRVIPGVGDDDNQNNNPGMPAAQPYGSSATQGAPPVQHMVPWTDPNTAQAGDDMVPPPPDSRATSVMSDGAGPQSDRSVGGDSDPTQVGARPLHRWGAVVAANNDDSQAGFSAAESRTSAAAVTPQADPQPPETTPSQPAEAAMADAQGQPSAGRDDPTAMPLYERMSVFRNSPFSKPAAVDQPTGPAGDSPTTIHSEVVPTGPAGAMGAEASPSADSMTSSSDVSAAPPPRRQYPTRARRPTESAPSNVANSAAPSSNGADTFREASAGSAGSPADSISPATPPARPTISATHVASRSTPVASSPGRAVAGVLLMQRSPSLSVETVGPQKIAVGKEATYALTVRNSGEVAAEDAVVRVDLPPWAEVSGAESVAGSVAAGDATSGPRQVLWKLGRLDANGHEQLTLRIIPRESRPLDLAVRCECKQGTTQAVIEVQEPKLAVRLDGPRELAYGRKETYRLRISNVGTGEAENVAARLMAVGLGSSPAASHNFGTLAAGQEKVVEVEMVARQPGTMTLKLEAAGEGGSRAEASEAILVRRAGLQAELEGPKMQFVDAMGVYRVRVKNSGNAPARHLVVAATLPPGAKFVSANDGVRPALDSGLVRWKLDALAPAAERTFELRCTLAQPGTARLDVACTADDDLALAVATATRVEAVAELVLDVVNPAGPVATSEDATYELRLANRGTKSAEEINVTAFFSQGLEPTSAQGAASRLAPGQVTFNTIPFLGAGKELRLKVNARAQTPGNHIFRAEVHCRPLATRLVREETTRFYAADGASSVAATAGDQASPTGPRTADRRSAP